MCCHKVLQVQGAEAILHSQPGVAPKYCMCCHKVLQVQGADAILQQPSVVSTACVITKEQRGLRPCRQPTCGVQSGCGGGQSGAQAVGSGVVAGVETCFVLPVQSAYVGT
jgi:hypothetical protein